MYLQRIPSNIKVLGSLIIFFGGVGFLGKAYLEAPNSEGAYQFFWIGLILCFVSVITIGGNRHSKPKQRVFGLLLLGSALYIPIYLRNPDYPIFQDELFHVQTLELMRDLKTSQIPITFFPIAGDYPGLEYVGLATQYATGLSINSVVRIISLGLHLIIPILAFYTYRTLGVKDSTAFYASLIYMANVGYFFFLGTYSYGTLGIVLFLFIVLLSIKKNGHEKAFTIAILLLLAMPSIVIVHHISSVIVVIYLILLTIITYILKNRSTLINIAIYSIILWFVWIIYRAVLSISYLYGNFAPRVVTILEFILSEQRQTHTLFLNSPLPPLERFIAYVYPILLFLLCALSIWNLFYKKRYHNNRPNLYAEYITLAIIGPVLWFILGPFILSNSAEIIYRISPYLFLGVGFYSALFICEWSQNNGILRQLVLISITFFILAGGIIIGDNQAGRFRANEVHTAAGPEVLTADIIHAANWLEKKYGRFNLTVGDFMSSVAFSVFGIQRTDILENWTPYYTADSTTAQIFINEKKIDYLVVDFRDSQFPPRYRYYFSQRELYDKSLQYSYIEKPLPLYLFMKFDKMPDLQRIYDNGDIVIYANKHISQLQFNKFPLLSVP